MPLFRGRCPGARRPRSSEGNLTGDDTHMARALELARRGAGHVHPNPMVGAVVVDGDTVVGEGWHQTFGGPHAEVHALDAAGARARGATVVLSALCRPRRSS